MSLSERCYRYSASPLRGDGRTGLTGARRQARASSRIDARQGHSEVQARSTVARPALPFRPRDGRGRGPGRSPGEPPTGFGPYGGGCDATGRECPQGAMPALAGAVLYGRCAGFVRDVCEVPSEELKLIVNRYRSLPDTVLQVAGRKRHRGSCLQDFSVSVNLSCWLDLFGPHRGAVLARGITPPVKR